MASQKCYRCSGSGKMTCTICHGRGSTTRLGMNGDLDLTPCYPTMRCSLCGGQGYLSWQEDSTAANTSESDSFRCEIQRQFKLLSSPAAEVVFIAFLGFGINKGIMRMSHSDLQQLTGSSNLLTARVTDELLLWLQDEGWLDVPANG